MLYTVLPVIDLILIYLLIHRTETEAKEAVHLRLIGHPQPRSEGEPDQSQHFGVRRDPQTPAAGGGEERIAQVQLAGGGQKRKVRVQLLDQLRGPRGLPRPAAEGDAGEEVHVLPEQGGEEGFDEEGRMQEEVFGQDAGAELELVLFCRLVDFLVFAVR